MMLTASNNLPTLRYSWHALDRAYERSLPVLDTLPDDARLADRDEDASIFRVSDDRGPFFLVISDDGTVVTLFRKTAANWRKWQEAKAIRRRLARLGNMRLE